MSGGKGGGLAERSALCPPAEPPSVGQPRNEKRSKPVQRVIRVLLIALVLPFALPLGYCTWSSLESASEYGYGLRDMDWDGDGHVSVSEFFQSADIGSRPAPAPEGEKCREFFSLKDGNTIRVTCRHR